MRPPIDTMAFPRAAGYLAALPGGLSAYPGCVIRADFFLEARADYPSLFEGLPAELVAQLASPYVTGDWMPLVHFMFAQHLVLDGPLRGDVHAFSDRIESRSVRLFGQMVYRPLMHLVSPNLMLLGASRRLDTFVRGIKYRLNGFSRRTHTATMAMPPASLGQLGVHFFAATFTAALRTAGAKNVQVTGELEAPDHATFQGTWSQ